MIFRFYLWFISQKWYIKLLLLLLFFGVLILLAACEDYVFDPHSGFDSAVLMYRDSIPE